MINVLHYFQPGFMSSDESRSRVISMGTSVSLQSVSQQPVAFVRRPLSLLLTALRSRARGLMEGGGSGFVMFQPRAAAACNEADWQACGLL